MKKYKYILTALLALTCASCAKKPGTADPTPAPVITDPVSVTPAAPTDAPVGIPKTALLESQGFVMENSTETKQIYITAYPIDDIRFVFQFDVVFLPIGAEFSETQTYTLCFEKQENGDYLHSKTDPNGNDSSLTASYIEGGEFMVSGNDSPLIGIYQKTDYRCNVADLTVLEFLKNVPAAGIADFSLDRPTNEIECYTFGDWFICCNLFSESKQTASFLVAKDFSAVLDMTASQGKVIYGSLEKTLNATYSYEIPDEDGAPVTIEEPLVFPFLANGTTMVAGSVDEVSLSAPYDLAESLKIVSGNTDIVTVTGTEVTALQPGSATLKITADYGGAVKDFTLDIEVVNADVLSDFDEYEEPADLEFVDPRYATYFDATSMRATMEICFEDGMIGVDILWADDANTEYHWSYVGSDEEIEGAYRLNGRYTIDTTNDDGSFSEKVIAEDITATLTKDANGCFYWYDCYEETDHDCIFELPQ